MSTDHEQSGDYVPANWEQTRGKLETAKRIGGVMLICFSTISYIYSEGSMLANQVQVDGHPDMRLGCAAPSEADLKAVDKLFAKPPTEFPTAESARQYGLTYIDWRPLPQDFKAADTSTPQGFNNLVKAANRMVRPYGVTLEIDHSSGISDEGWHAPTPKQLTSHSAKQNLINLMDDFSHLTVEYVHLSGVKKIILTANTTNKKEGTVVAYVDQEDKGEIFDNLRYDWNRTTLGHELEHEIDAKECLGMQDEDLPLERINKTNIYTRGYGGKISYDRYVDGAAARLRDMIRLSEHPNRKYKGMSSAKVLQQVKNVESEMAKRVATSTAYGFYDEEEDKAEIARFVEEPRYLRTELDPSRPILAGKTRLILARLYEKSPRIVKWLAAAGETLGPPLNSVKPK